MTARAHTIEWGRWVDQKYPHDHSGWPFEQRQAVTGAMEKGLAAARARWPGCTVVSDHSECNPMTGQFAGKWCLYRCITVAEAA